MTATRSHKPRHRTPVQALLGRRLRPTRVMEHPAHELEAESLPAEIKLLLHTATDRVSVAPPTLATACAVDTEAPRLADVGYADVRMPEPAVVSEVSFRLAPIKVAEQNLHVTAYVEGAVWHSGKDALAGLYGGGGAQGRRRRSATPQRQRVRTGTPDSLAALRTGGVSGADTRAAMAELYGAHGLSALLAVLIDTDLLARSYGPLVLPNPIYEFQRDGIDFLLASRPGALRADDMGLGKTVQAIVALRWLFHDDRTGGALVVAPKSVLPSWESHFRQWAPELRVASLTASPRERARRWQSLRTGHVDVAVVSYDTLSRDAQLASDPGAAPFKVLIADEVQLIKSPSTKRAKVMRSLAAERRWALSGTPLENSASEFSAVLRFVDPVVRDLEYRAGYMDSRDANQIRRHAERLMLRRRKQQVLHDLPKLNSSVVPIALGRQQRRAYDRAERHGISELLGKPRNITSVLELVHVLKQICNGIPGHSAKLDWLSHYLDVAAAEGDKTLVYSQYTHKLPPEMMALFALRYQGDMSARERERAIEELSARPDYSAMLMSLKAGGLGLNLQAANRVVHYDSWWNPAVQAQATDRVHRIGQTKTVFETTLVATGTIEERIQTLLEHKRELFDRVVDDLSVEGAARLITRDEWYEMFGIGPHR